MKTFSNDTILSIQLNLLIWPISRADYHFEKQAPGLAGMLSGSYTLPEKPMSCQKYNMTKIHFSMVIFYILNCKMVNVWKAKNNYAIYFIQLKPGYLKQISITCNKVLYVYHCLSNEAGQRKKFRFLNGGKDHDLIISWRQC